HVPRQSRILRIAQPFSQLRTSRKERHVPGFFNLLLEQRAILLDHLNRRTRRARCLAVFLSQFQITSKFIWRRFNTLKNDVRSESIPLFLLFLHTKIIFRKRFRHGAICPGVVPPSSWMPYASCRNKTYL